MKQLSYRIGDSYLQESEQISRTHELIINTLKSLALPSELQMKV
jgi:hypothetical protein